MVEAQQKLNSQNRDSNSLIKTARGHLVSRQTIFPSLLFGQSEILEVISLSPHGKVKTGPNPPKMSSINRHTQPILHSILHALDDSGGAEGRYDVALQLDWNPQSISSELEQYAHDKWHPSTPRGALNFADACRAINKLAMANLETYAFVTRRFDAELLAWTADLVKELVGGQSVLKHGREYIIQYP